MTANDLYVWQPDRRRIFARTSSPAFSADGSIVRLVDGILLPRGRDLFLLASGAGRLGDFLYDVALQLFVSELAFGAISSAVIPGVRPYPVCVVNRAGEKLAGYYWLNQCSAYALLDRGRSDFRASERGVMHEIRRFLVLEDNIPEEDLFLCDDNSARIFSRRLVEAITVRELTGALFRPLQGSRWP